MFHLRLIFFFIQKIFGLPSSSTASRSKSNRFPPGINEDIIARSAQLYDGELVVEASDEARVRRYCTIHSLGFS